MIQRQTTEALNQANKTPKRPPDEENLKTNTETHSRVMFKIPKEYLQPKKMVSKLKAYTVLKTKAARLIG